MVAATARGDRGLLQAAQPRRRLAGVENVGAGAGDRLDEPGGQRRHPGEMTEEVERGPLGGEDGGGGPGGEHQLRWHLLAPLPLDHEPVDVLDSALAHRLLDDLEAEGNPRLLLDDPRPRPGALRHRRLRGDVAGTDVLRQRPRNEVLQRLTGIGHRRTLANASAVIFPPLGW